MAGSKPEKIYGQEKLCSKNQTHDCRCGKINTRTKDCAKGSNRRGDYCRRCRRCRRGHEVNGRPGRPDSENRGEKAVWKKQNEDGQDRAKEKTLDKKHQSLSVTRPAFKRLPLSSIRASQSSPSSPQWDLAGRQISALCLIEEEQARCVLKALCSPLHQLRHSSGRRYKAHGLQRRLVEQPLRSCDPCRTRQFIERGIYSIVRIGGGQEASPDRVPIGTRFNIICCQFRK